MLVNKPISKCFFILSIHVLFLVFIFNVTSYGAPVPSEEFEPTVKYMIDNKLLNVDFIDDYEKPVTNEILASLLLDIYEAATQNKSSYKLEEAIVDIKNSKFKSKIEKSIFLGYMQIDGSGSFAPDKVLNNYEVEIIINDFLKALYPGYKMSWPQGDTTIENVISFLYSLAEKTQLVERSIHTTQGAASYQGGDDFSFYGNKAFIQLNNEKVKNIVYYIDTNNKQAMPKSFSSAVTSGFKINKSYYFSSHKDTEGNWQLSRYNFTTNEKILIAQNDSPIEFALDGDWVYYVKDKNKIYKSKNDGSCKSVIYLGKSNISKVFSTKGFVYVVEDELGLVRFKIDGTAMTLLFKGSVNDFVVYENFVYFLLKRTNEMEEEAKNGLYYIDLSGKKEVVHLAGRVDHLYTNKNGVIAYSGEPMEENAMYKIAGGKITKMNAAALKVLLLNNGRNLYLDENNRLFYTVYKPVSKDEPLDYQNYGYTNVIDLNTFGSADLFGDKMKIHCYKELIQIYGKIEYQYDNQIDQREVSIIENAIKAIHTIIKPEMTEYEKVKAVHDFIILNTKYASDKVNDAQGEILYSFYENSFNPSYIDSYLNNIYSPYGVLVEGTAVCQGYSETMALLLNMIGIETYYVAGKARNSQTGGIEAHSWNLVKIDGKYYYVDATWDDPTPDVAGRIIYKYFNVTEAQLSKDHSWDTSKFKKLPLSDVPLAFK